MSKESSPVQVDDLLVEIGTEELPPASLDQLRTSFQALFEEELTTQGFSFKQVSGHATPRRLALVVQGLSRQQPDRQVERRGPAVKAAWDQAGQPTKALSGFAKSCGVADLSTLTTIQTDKGEWVVYQSTESGKSLDAQLESMLNRAVSQLPIDRRMRWGKRRDEFVRPVKWLLVLYGKTLLPISLFGLTAGRVSYGHPFMNPGPFKLSRATDYIGACEKRHVITSVELRKARIRAQVQALAAELEAEVEMDEALLDEITALVEWPVALAGRFDDKYLELPAGILISVMKKHQRYFHLVDSSGRLLPRFITLANLESKDPAVVIAGNERVIKPRLADAAFFYEQDAKISLEARADKLQRMVFQSALGSYQEKASRIARLAGFIASQVGSDQATATRAGLLCKADLTSDMVAEFPELQGVMGYWYARQDGESEAVATAIGQHYRPVQSGGVLPDERVAACVALADKLDTLVGLFGINQPPTGSKDPYGLRRQSLGVIRICIEQALDLDLVTCLHHASDLYGQDFDTGPVHEYMLERLTHWCAERHITGDIIEALRFSASGATNLWATFVSASHLKAFRGEANTEKIIAANKRIANILKSEPADNQTEVDTGLLEDGAEKTLHREFMTRQSQISKTQTFAEKLEPLAGLQAHVDNFFRDVLVMSDNDALKNNRLALLRNLRQLFLEVADFSLLK